MQFAKNSAWLMALAFGAVNGQEWGSFSGEVATIDSLIGNDFALTSNLVVSLNEGWSLVDIVGRRDGQIANKSIIYNTADSKYYSTIAYTNTATSQNDSVVCFPPVPIRISLNQNSSGTEEGHQIDGSFAIGCIDKSRLGGASSSASSTAVPSSTSESEAPSSSASSDSGALVGGVIATTSIGSSIASASSSSSELILNAASSTTTSAEETSSATAEVTSTTSAASSENSADTFSIETVSNPDSGSLVFATATAATSGSSESNGAAGVVVVGDGHSSGSSSASGSASETAVSESVSTSFSTVISSASSSHHASASSSHHASASGSASSSASSTGAAILDQTNGAGSVEILSHASFCVAAMVLALAVY